ncbi:hypothetical protein EMIT0111MI5_40248 [Burkholderia sp. IT-111MI5]
MRPPFPVSIDIVARCIADRYRR